MFSLSLKQILLLANLCLENVGLPVLSAFFAVPYGGPFIFKLVHVIMVKEQVPNPHMFKLQLTLEKAPLLLCMPVNTLS